MSQAAVSMNRKERLARIAKAAKMYGIKGQEALDIHEAYNALARGEVARAVQLAHPITAKHPSHHHAWIIMGGAALARREGKTAQAFFGHALRIRPNDPLVLGGMAKGHILEAQVEEAVALAPRAFQAGSEDSGLARLYMDLMSQLGRRLLAAELVAPLVGRLKDAPLCLRLANMLVDADEPGKAARWYEKAYELDPSPEAHKLGKLRGLLSQCRFEDAETLALDLMDHVKDRDTVIVLYMLLLRVTGRAEQAAALAEETEFQTPEAFAHARGVMANIHQDRGEDNDADQAFVEAIHITGNSGNMAKAYGVFLYRKGEYATGSPYFAQRFPEQQRARIPFENAAPDNLSKLGRVILVSEQGVGDQLAMLELLKIAPLAEGAKVTFVADARFGPLLENNRLGLVHHDKTEFLSNPQLLAPNEMVYLGDLSRYLAGTEPETRHGGYLVPDAARVTDRRQKYLELAAGAPIVGVAWKSTSLIGYMRSIPLIRLVESLPQDALVVNLQYGDCRQDIAAAAAIRPDLRFVTDDTVNQMADLAGFAAQISALDRVATIDNTTAHVCGALGHAGANLLIPEGAECMWYWGGTGSRDPWYGAATLHRQVRAGDWSAPLAKLKQALTK